MTSQHKKKGKKQFQKSIKKIDYLWWGMLIIISVIVLITRIKLFNMPLERDEGEYGYMAQLFLQGVTPYSESYNMKLPGTSFIYAIFIGLFGSTSVAIRIGLLVIHSLTAYFMFLCGYRLLNLRTAIMTVSLYLVLCISANVLGFAAHATHFIVLFMIIGLWVLLKNQDHLNWKILLWSGFLFGLSFLMKQSAIFFIFFGLTTCVLFSLKNRLSILESIKNCLFFSLGASLPYILLSVFLLLSGSFQNFWFWTVEYLVNYGTAVGVGDAFSIFNLQFNFVKDGFIFIWASALFGIFLLFISKRYANKKYLLLSMLLFSILAVSLGFYFRRHYFIQILPIVCILSAIAFDSLIHIIQERGPKNKSLGMLSVFGVFVVLLAIGMNKQSYLLTQDNISITNKIYGSNPFIESKVIGEKIKSLTDKEDKVLVFGSEPEINFYSHRKSPTGIIYTYSLMESHDLALKMQDDYIAEVEADPPKIIVGIKNNLSWLQSPKSNTKILGWFDGFLKQHNYRTIGAVDRNQNKIDYYFDELISEFKPSSDTFILIYEKP